MSYRDDLDAAHARAEATARENDVLRARIADAAVAGGPLVAQPERFRVTETADELRIAWRWFELKHLALLVFCIGWNAFLASWYTTAAEHATWVHYVVPIGHVAVGLALSYVTLAGLLNRTVLRIQGGRFTVTHGPLPWRGRLDLPGSDVAQLYVTAKVTPVGSHDETRVRTTHELKLIERGGRERVVVRGLPSFEQARFLEILLERRLGIVDGPVVGEVSG